MIARLGTKYLFKIWNPGKRFTDRGGNTIKDIGARRRSKFVRETLNRKPGERKNYRCGVYRNLTPSGK